MLTGTEYDDMSALVADVENRLEGQGIDFNIDNEDGIIVTLIKSWLILSFVRFLRLSFASFELCFNLSGLCDPFLELLGLNLLINDGLGEGGFVIVVQTGDGRIGVDIIQNGAIINTIWNNVYSGLIRISNLAFAPEERNNQKPSLVQMLSSLKSKNFTDTFKLN